jgi:SAM-dependent methyltransferase
MHLALNPDGEFDRDGYLGPVREVERRIPGDASAILELAVGTGFNIAYLAPRHPQIDFSGVDLTPAHIRAARRRTAHLENVGVHLENFQRLSYEDTSFDVVFVVESLCHATDMPRALCEAHRVLRPDGRLIVIDGWRGESFRALPELARRAAAVTEQAMSVGAPWALGDWLDEARAHRFQLSEEIDISPWIMPNLERLERFAASYFHHPVLARLCARLAPTRLLANAIAGYLMPLTVAVGAHTYRLVSMRRA